MAMPHETSNLPSWLGVVMGGARLLHLDGRGGSARTQEEGIMAESKRLVGALLLGGPWGSMV